MMVSRVFRVPRMMPYTFPRTRMAGYRFDGVDDYIDCGNDSSLDITDEITIEAWLKYITLGTTVIPVGKKYAYDILTLFNTNFYAELWIESLGKVGFDTGYHLQANTWYHLVSTYDSATGDWRMYINRNLIKDKTLSGEDLHIKTTTNSLYIGSFTSSDYHINGIINSVSIHNEALSPSAIRKLYEGRKLPTDFDSCVLWLPFYLGDAMDRSGYGNHGTNYGAIYTIS